MAKGIGPGKEIEIGDSSDFVRWEKNLEARGRQLRAVRDEAINLANNNPDKFSVRPRGNNSFVGISAETELDATVGDEQTRLRLSIGVEAWKGGSMENSVNISSTDGKTWADDGAVSYRLDASQGSQVEEEHQRLKDLEVSEKKGGFFGVLKAMRKSSYEKGKDGVLTDISDNYAETTIETGDALDILKNAKNLQKPANGGVSLTDFQKMMQEQEEKRNNTPKLPGLFG